MQTVTEAKPESCSAPPFRAEQVGSLLRPQYLIEARDQFSRGAIGEARLRGIENQAIAHVVERQEALGLQVITDGELRRAYFHLDFLEKIEGVTVTGNIAASSDAQKTVGFTPPKISVTGKVRHTRNIQLEDFKFLQSRTERTPKVMIPSPTMLHFRGGRAAIDQSAYPHLDEFFSDLAQCWRDEIESLYQAGCRYLCDPIMCEGARERGEDPTLLPHTYARLISEAVRNHHDDLSIGIHVCRGNFRSTWFSSGGYEPIAEVLFNELDIDTYFLEYDDERSGDFAPLRFVPDKKKVVLGLVSSKLPTLEEKGQVIARIEEASRYLALDNLCLSPQCGFASTYHGNHLSEADQWAKLELIREITDEIWL